MSTQPKTPSHINPFPRCLPAIDLAVSDPSIHLDWTEKLTQNNKVDQNIHKNFFKIIVNDNSKL